MTLISDEYRAQQRQLHAERDDYGVASVKFAPLVTHMVNLHKISTLLDYGAGKGRLRDALNPVSPVMVECYDPGIEEFSSEPDPAELVCCIDVLEHIEPDNLHDVLAHLASKTERFAFLTVHCGPAAKVLPDGRNAHLIQEPPEWWLPQLNWHFAPLEYRWVGSGFVYIGGRRVDHNLQRASNRSRELDESDRPDQSDT